MRKTLQQLRKMKRCWKSVLEAFNAEAKMKQSKVEANHNGAAAPKEPER